ncbi:MAG: hypothetical protein ACRD44_11900 [Bryobacteraceae bacterium]
MGQEYSAGNVTTGVMVLLSAFTIFTRFRFRVDHNWPLVYYLAVFAYHIWAPESLNPWVIYAGVVVTLLLRFEFMGGGFLKFMRAIDLGTLALLTYGFLVLMTA